MPSLLVDPSTLQNFSLVDPSAYDPQFLYTRCQVAHMICATHLGYDPALQTHTNEEGEASIIHTGRDAYQITFRLKTQPLADRSPSVVFSALQLIFAAPFPTLDLLQNAGAFNTVVVRQRTGRVYCPFLGTGGLSASMFSYGNGLTPITGPTGFLATYVAGYAISSADSTAYPNAVACPVDLQQAAAFILEVLLGQAQRISSDVQNAITGTLQSFKNQDYSERYAEMKTLPSTLALGNTILYGTQNGLWARELLDKHARSAAEKVLLV